MIKRSTWILLAVFFIALATAIYYSRSPLAQEKEEPAATPQPRLLEGWSNDRVYAIEFTYGERQTYRLKIGADNRWQAVGSSEPIGQGKVEELLTSLLSLQVLASLDSPNSLIATGFDQGLYRVTITDAGGIQSTIQIGQATPTNSGYYILLDDHPPVIVNKYAVDTLLVILHPDKLKPSAEDVPSFTLPAEPPSVPSP